MKRCLLKKSLFLMLCSIFVICSLNISCFAFSGETHQYATQHGISLVRDTFKGKVAEFYNDSVKDKIFEFCTKPDEDETDGAFKMHFYNPDTDKNFMGEDESALAMFKMHYANALKYYKKNEKVKSCEELGRAIHFLEDLNTPVHTNNQSLMDSATNLAFHVSFENRCKKIQFMSKVKMDAQEFNYFINNSLNSIGKASAGLAHDNFYVLYNKLVDKDTVVLNAIENAQKAVAGVLYKFYCQVQNK